jgi:hypothetical protein
MSIVKEILKTRKYKAGYEVRTETWANECDVPPVEMKSAYTPSGDYIGNAKDAHYLVVKRGIKPEKSSLDHCVCSIGFCEADSKWYGWSHRAIHGFGIGSTVKLGDCAFNPSNKEEFIKSLESWYSEEMYKNVKIEDLGDKIVVSHEIHPKGGGEILYYTEEHPIADIKFGNGEWTAKTLEDAKQMAIDFADDVS